MILFAECDLFLEHLKLENPKEPTKRMFDVEVHSCFFANWIDCDHLFENCRSKLLCSLKLCKMDVRYFENICFHGTPSLSLKELAFCFMSTYDYMVETAWKISMWSTISHDLFHSLLRLYSFKVILIRARKARTPGGGSGPLQIYINNLKIIFKIR